MSSASLVDYLAEKLYSYSSKMRGDSFEHNVTSFLMSGNNSLQPYGLPKVLCEVKENSIFPVEIGNPYYPFLPLLGPLRMLSGLKYISGTEKPDNFLSYRGEKGQFSPHLFNLVLDSYRYRHSHSDSSLIPSASMFFSSFKESLLGESHKMSQHSKTDSDTKKISDPPVVEAKMPMTVSHSPAMKKSEVAEEKGNFSQRLNLELAHRKTKEMNKRSKKRRRRQKRIEHLNMSNSTSASDDDVDCNLPSPVTSSICFIAESPEFGCTLSVKQTVQMSPCKSFIIPVSSDSDDDSEWETFDEIELSNTSDLTACSEIDCKVFSSPESSPIKSESSESKYLTSRRCSTPVHVASAVMSFIVPEDDSSDDSDWDSCETDCFTEETGFEFTGLFLTNLCTPQTLSSKSDCDFAASSDEECDEIKQLRAVLLEVNKNWNELTKDDDDKKPKSVSKVTFAADEDLVEVFPVEIYERKGEWEMYATERLRFKRKIDELEKVLSPCLNAEHRSKIFKKLVEPNL